MATLEIHDLHVSVEAENGPREILRGVIARGLSLR